MTQPYYRDYLQLPHLLSAQRPLSPCHDEFLFVVTHQVFELWFRQILRELESVVQAFSAPRIEERILGDMVPRLERVKDIVRLFPPQLDILETMKPMDFLEFRDLLGSASGFQSLQFRQVEHLLGVPKAPSGGQDEADCQAFEKYAADHPPLPGLVEKWLERMPFAQGNFDFWREYTQALDRASFESLVDEAAHAKLVSQGKRHLSRGASLNALFILSYRREPILRVPCQFLSALLDIDEHVTTWRYRHSLLAHRMLGTKTGTGGSSGHAYLRGTAEQNRPFRDLFDLAGFLISPEKLPPMPEKLRESLDFRTET